MFQDVSLGFKCDECGFPKQLTVDWFRCKDQRFCSAECAVVFLLKREEGR